MEKLFHANRNKKRAGQAILIPQKLELERKIVKKDKHFNHKGINPICGYNNCKHLWIPKEAHNT